MHRSLKALYGPDRGGRSEVVVDGYRIDAIAPDGELIEVQTGSLGPLRGKVCRLLGDHRVRIVKPIAVRTRVVRRRRADGEDLSARFSPKRRRLIDAFDDIIGLIAVFPHANLSIEVLQIEIDEVRVPRRRWPGHLVADRRLLEVVDEPISIIDPIDLWRLFPAIPGGWFSTVELAESLGISPDFARKVAYCLCQAGATELVGKAGNRRLYAVANTRSAMSKPLQDANW